VTDRALKFVVFVLAAVLASMLLTCSSCKESQLETVPQAELPSGVTDKLDRLVSALMEQNNIPGAIAGVWVNGEGAWIKAAGIADLQEGTAEQADLHFRIGSITKTFTATVILQLVDEGKLSLGDKLEEYVGGFKYGDQITILQLCNNTSGIFNYGDAPGLVEENVSHPQRHWSPEELIDLASSGEPSFPPGTGWKYSNSNFLLLGVIIEQVTGNDLGSEIEARITQPLGLDSTFLPADCEFGGPHSHGYVQWDGRWGKTEPAGLDDVTYWDPSHAWAAGGMISTLEDLRVWAKALATGELLSEEMQRERLAWVQMPGGESLDMKYGMGIFSMGGLIGHDGMLWGYNTGMYYYPEHDATIVVFFNRAMDQKDGEWVAYDIPFTMAAASILFPGEMPWDTQVNDR